VSGDLEGALARLDELTQEAKRASAQLAKAVAAVEKQAKHGDLASLRDARAKLAEAGRVAQTAAARCADAWPWPAEADEERYLADGYGAELAAAAEARGMRCYPYDGGWSAFPVLLRTDPRGRTLRIDRKKSKSLRPSVVVDQIAAARRAKPRQSPERFIEILYAGYRAAAGINALEQNLFRSEAAVQLVDVYKALTTLPDAAKEYPIEEFQRDIHQLNMSGVRATKAGAEVHFSAATGTKGAGRSVLTVIDEHATPHHYFSVNFRAAGR